MASAEPLNPHGVALFEDRIILDARPPITEAELAGIEARCAGPVPEGLRQLWSVSFGGRVDYALSVAYDGHVHAFSFTELFFPGSGHYRDLPGWIAHEADLAAEARGAAWNGKLTHLPFGGFEYLERMYVCVEPGPDYGAVFAYSEGIPPAWILSLHEASVARVADDVPALFRMLDLPRDPFDDPEEFESGAELAATIDEIATADSAVANRLRGLVRTTVVDWRTALADGRIASQARPRQLALDHAASTGDLDLFSALKAAGCDLDEAFRGGGAALDHALAHGQLEAARWLIADGVRVDNAITNGAHQAPPEMVADLLARGAKPTALAAQQAARAGKMESAVLITNALARIDPPAVRKLIDDLAYWAGGAEATARRIDASALVSNVSAGEYRDEGARMRALRDHSRSLVVMPSLWSRLFGR